MKTKQKNKELEKVREKLSQLNYLALHDLAMGCYKKAMKANKKLKKAI